MTAPLDLDAATKLSKEALAMQDATRANKWAKVGELMYYAVDVPALADALLQAVAELRPCPDCSPT